MKTKLIILFGILLIVTIVPLSGCSKDVEIRDIGVGEQLFYLFEDEYAYMDTKLEANDNFTPKLLHNLFDAEGLGTSEAEIGNYMQEYHMKDVVTGEILTYEDYLLYQDYELAIFDLLGGGYTSSFYIPGIVIAIGGPNNDTSPVVKDGVVSVKNEGENDIAIVVYQLDGSVSDIDDIERDHLYYVLDSSGALERFTTYIKEDDLFYLGEGVTLGEMVDYFFDGDYMAFYEETPLNYFKDNRTVTLDELMQEIDVNVDVFTSENVGTYIRVPGQLVFISQNVSYHLDGEYLYIGSEYSGEILVGYTLDNN